MSVKIRVTAHKMREIAQEYNSMSAQEQRKQEKITCDIDEATTAISSAACVGRHEVILDFSLPTDLTELSKLGFSVERLKSSGEARFKIYW